MPNDVLIADELLADAIDSGDRTAVSEALDRPDPFENMWDELGRMPDMNLP